MKNYLCINGKKIALTEEQEKALGIKPIATLSDDGKTAMIGDYEFIVLKNDVSLGTVELLLNKSLKNMKFGKDNDYRKSDIRKEVEKFGEEIEKIVGEENLLEHNVDLTTLDGLKDFGSIKAKMSLLTFDKARENIETLDKYKIYWWWFATALSTKKHDIEYSVICVSPCGFMSIDYCTDSDLGVRPFCILKSTIFQSCEE